MQRLDSWEFLNAFAFAEGPDLSKIREKLNILLLDLLTGIDTKKKIEDVGGVSLKNFADKQHRV
jgi:hypothetical protein